MCLEPGRVEGDTTKGVLKEGFCVWHWAGVGRRRGRQAETTWRRCPDPGLGRGCTEKGELDTASQLPIFLRPREVKSLVPNHTAAGLQTLDLIQFSDFRVLERCHVARGVFICILFSPPFGLHTANLRRRLRMSHGTASPTMCVPETFVRTGALLCCKS